MVAGFLVMFLLVELSGSVTGALDVRGGGGVFIPLAGGVSLFGS